MLLLRNILYVHNSLFIGGSSSPSRDDGDHSQLVCSHHGFMIANMPGHVVIYPSSNVSKLVVVFYGAKFEIIIWKLKPYSGQTF